MSTIDIRRPHALTLASAKKQADLMADNLADEFSLESAWQGDELHFKRSGVKGVMKVGKGDVHVYAELGFLVAFLKPQIEKRLHAHFDEIFDGAGAKKAAAKPAAPKAAPVKKTAAKPAAKTAAKKAGAGKAGPRR